MEIIHEIEEASVSVEMGLPFQDDDVSESAGDEPLPAKVEVTIVAESTHTDNTIAEGATWQTRLSSTVNLLLSELGSLDVARARLGPALAELGVEEANREQVARSACDAVARGAHGAGRGLVVPVEVRLEKQGLRFRCEAWSERVRAAMRQMAWVPHWPASREAESCPVCLENLGCRGGEYSVARTPCGHYFHGDCLLHWMKESDSCPVCRFEILES